MKTNRHFALSIRTWLIGFVLLFPIIGAVSSWLSYRAGREAIQSMVMSLHGELKQEIHRTVAGRLQSQHRINQTNEEAYLAGILDIHDYNLLRRHFWVQMHNEPSTAYIYHSDEDGRFCGVMRGSKGEFLYTENPNPSPSEYDIYAMRSMGEKGPLKKHLPPLDFRKRTWYSSPVAAKAEVWGAVFSQYDILRINIPLSRPIYDRSGKFQGVFGINMDVTPLSEFLASVTAKVTGSEAFLIEKNGYVIATSDRKPFRIDSDRQPSRYRGHESDNEVLRIASQQLLKQPTGYVGLNEPQQIQFDVDGARYFISADPFLVGPGIQWTMLIASPEASFLGAVRQAVKTNLYLIIITLGLTALLGFFFIRSLTQPLSRLVKQTNELSTGRVTSLGVESHIREVDALRESFEESAQTVAAREQALRESEERFRALVENAPMAIMLLHKGKIVFVNPESARLLGYAGPEEIEGRDPFELIAADYHDLIRHRIKRIEQDNDNPPVELELLTKDGESVKTVSASVSISMDGQPAAVIVAQDISELMRAEEEKARLEEQVQKSQKLESIGRLAGGIAHDLNNLLSPVIGYSEFLLMKPDKDATRNEQVNEILRAGMRARDLVRQLLAFSRKQTLEFTFVDINELLAEFEKLLRRTIREDIAIQMTLDPSIPFIKGDAGQLEQVIMNLVVNAQDAMQKGGKVTIETQCVELDATYASKHEAVTPGSYVMVMVSDTGAGMDESTQQHIFEPFFSTKGKDKGTGLGLATVYGIVKQHRGSIWVYSEPGMGTSFKVYLPVTEDTPIIEKSPAAIPTDLRGSETIMLVEDNEQVRDLTHQILIEKGYHALVAANGRQALDQLDSETGPIHLLLTDVVMPEMNGKQLYERIRLNYPEIKVLYMSGYTDNVIAHHGVIDPNTNLIHKPFSVKKLAARLREILDQE